MTRFTLKCIWESNIFWYRLKANPRTHAHVCDAQKFRYYDQ